MDMMVRILDGQIPGKDMPFRIGPDVPIIHQKNVHEWKFERLFCPRDFKAIIDFSPR
jgi:protein TorT